MQDICLCGHLESVHGLIVHKTGEGIGDPTLAPHRRGPCGMCSCPEFRPTMVV